jgi:hypothetical protein
MTRPGNNLSIGGNVNGNAIAGDGNTVSSSPASAAENNAVTRLFVSYRTNDSVYAAAAIADGLAARFGPDNVFRDRDSLALGAMYPARIRRGLEQADTVLAVMGPAWLTLQDSTGGRCIDNPRDWVRMELQMAFERGIPVIPVLLDDTPFPDRDQLPADIAALSRCTYWQVRHQSFESDIQGLIDGITREGKLPRQDPRA